MSIGTASILADVLVTTTFSGTITSTAQHVQPSSPGTFVELTETELAVKSQEEGFPLNDKETHSWLRAKHRLEYLESIKDPTLSNLEPGTWIGVHPDKGVLHYEKTREELVRKLGKHELVFRYKAPLDIFRQRAVISTKEATSWCQKVAVTYKVQPNSQPIPIDLVVDTGATATQLRASVLEDQAKYLGYVPNELGDGSTRQTKSYEVEFLLDDLISVTTVLAGVPVLGIDIIKRYDSVWNWNNPNSAVTMTRRATVVDDEPLYDDEDIVDDNE